jgi:ABC-type lipoprotein export system ATPase subunit
MSGPVVDLRGVEVVLGGVFVLPRVDLRLDAGESLALTGPSGSGKTTLLDCVLGLRRPTAGHVVVLGSDVGRVRPARHTALRRRSIGVVSQNPQLLPELDVAENVAISLLFDGEPRGRALDAARAALCVVGLEDAGSKRPEHLSGGEAQRAAVARALVRPDVRLLVADEPTAALDADNVDLVAGLLVGATRARGISLLIATHDQTVARQCDRVQDLRQQPLVPTRA